MTEARCQLDLGALYPRLTPQLQRVLTANLDAPDWLIDEACQLAWTRLLNCEVVIDDERALSWLATTARREALMLMRRRGLEVSLDQLAHTPSEPAGYDDDPSRCVELRERLESLRRLSPRQQRMLWLRGLGFKYQEIAARTGESNRAVQRQLQSARRNLASV